MRKNGIDRDIREIEGGVCAVEDFFVVALDAGMGGEAGKKDLALLSIDGKCSVAFIGSEGGVYSPCSELNKKHAAKGYAHALVVNGGIANVCAPQGMDAAILICRGVASRLHISTEETLFVSTGTLGEAFPLSSALGKIGHLAGLLGSKDELDGFVSSFDAFSAAYSFMLGGVRCKIGAAVTIGEKGNVFILTSDVNIEPSMLQRALEFAHRETLQLTDFEATPLDSVCIFSKRNMYNYAISQPDSDYERFALALSEIIFKLCEQAARRTGVALTCKVTGAKSKKIARVIAKSIVNSRSIKDGLKNGTLHAQTLLNATHANGEGSGVKNACFRVTTQRGSVVLFEDGSPMRYAEQALQKILPAEYWTVEIELGEGCFASHAVGRL